jgi:RNAse (barnase) inhibitor barstar
LNNHINFQSIEAPFIHFTSDMELFLQLYKQVSENSSNELFLTSIDGKDCSNKAALFNTFSAKLQFPDYFGNNWDAFNDCLTDLEWLNSNQYVLFIKNFEETLTQNQGELDIFFEIVEDAIKEWNAGTDYGIERLTMPFHLVIHANTNIAAELSSKLQELEVNEILQLNGL